MKSKKHYPEQIIKKLREADAMLAAEKSIGQICQALQHIAQIRPDVQIVPHRNDVVESARERTSYG